MFERFAPIFRLLVPAHTARACITDVWRIRSRPPTLRAPGRLSARAEMATRSEQIYATRWSRPPAVANLGWWSLGGDRVALVTFAAPLLRRRAHLRSMTTDGPRGLPGWEPRHCSAATLRLGLRDLPSQSSGQEIADRAGRS